ncbi:MAG: SDR family oxidoreductase [Thermoactinomyces sp.]
MDLGLKGKSALIAASSKGLGKAIAMELAAEGANVVVSGRNEEQLQKAVAEIEAVSGGKVAACAADVTKPEDIQALIQFTAAQQGGIDVLVTNAGGPPAGSFDDFDDEDWEKAFQLNLLSVIRLIRGALPYMRGKKAGRIVNLASSSFKQPIDNLILSNTFRTAVVGLSKSLAVELGKDGILINTIGPGRISTDRIVALDRANAKKTGLSPNEVRSRNTGQIPLGRYGTPEEFAKVVAFLVSEANTYVTGQAFLVDGGMVKSI